LQLDWRGKSNDRQPGKILRPFFTEVQSIAAADGKTKNLKLVTVFSGALKWQKLSFEALRIFEKPDGMLTFRIV